MAGVPFPAPLERNYASETEGTAANPNLFVRRNGDEEAVMYIGIGGLILFILILVLLF